MVIVERVSYFIKRDLISGFGASFSKGRLLDFLISYETQVASPTERPYFFSSTRAKLIDSFVILRLLHKQHVQGDCTSVEPKSIQKRIFFERDHSRASQALGKPQIKLASSDCILDFDVRVVVSFFEAFSNEIARVLVPEKCVQAVKFEAGEYKNTLFPISAGGLIKSIHSFLKRAKKILNEQVIVLKQATKIIAVDWDCEINSKLQKLLPTILQFKNN
jgi:hypothetical protein